MDFGAISLPVLALSALFGYAVFFDINSVIFNKMNVPAALEYQGYKGDVVAARIANEVRDINKKARTVRELKEFELAPVGIPWLWTLTHRNGHWVWAGRLLQVAAGSRIRARGRH